MKTQRVLALASSVLMATASAGSWAGEPSSADVVEDVVVTARYPARPMEEIVVTGKHPGDTVQKTAITDPDEAPVMEEIVVTAKHPAASAGEPAESAARPIDVAARPHLELPPWRVDEIALPELDDIRL